MAGSRQRVRIFAAVVFAASALITVRLFYLQVLARDLYREQASQLHLKKFEIPAKRGIIYVHDGDELVPVALNQTVKLLYADPSFVKDKKETARKIAEIVAIEETELVKLLDRDSEYEVIARELSQEEEAKFKELDLPGVVMKSWHKRVYPEDDFMAAVVGFVNQDGIGQYGVEKVYEKELAGSPGLTRTETDARGVPILTSENIVKPAIDGADIVLTIDRTIQGMAELKLREAAKRYNFEGGSIIIEESRTGRILAMASLPSFNPNEFYKVKDYRLFDNPATDRVYEPGSVMKVFTMAAGLQNGVITPDKTFTDSGSVVVDNHEIKNYDGKANGTVTMTQVLEKSINIGSVWVASQLGDGSINQQAKTRMYEMLTKFGFGERTGFELTSENKGILSRPESVSNHTYATMSFGQSISVTPLQLVNGVNAVANGGKLISPRIIERIKYSDGQEKIGEALAPREAIAPKTAAQLTAMMVSVVDRGGARRAGVPGYSVAGKTGSAQIPATTGGYDPASTEGSFIGFIPAESPKVTALIRLSKPKVRFAGPTAAVVFGELISQVAAYLEIPTTR